MRAILLLLCFSLVGCISSGTNVEYTKETRPDGYTKETWKGDSAIIASGDSAVGQANKNIDFGVEMPNGTKAHLKGGSEQTAIKSENADLYLRILEALFDKATATQ